GSDAVKGTLGSVVGALLSGQKSSDLEVAAGEPWIAGRRSIQRGPYPFTLQPIAALHDGELDTEQSGPVGHDTARVGVDGSEARFRPSLVANVVARRPAVTEADPDVHEPAAIVEEDG